MNEVSVEEYAQIVREEAYKKIIESLGNILKALNTPNESSTEVRKQTIAIKELINAISLVPQPIVQVETNQEVVVNSIQNLSNIIIEKQDITNRLLIEGLQMKDYIFTPIKDRFGEIISITAKQIKQINNENR